MPVSQITQTLSQYPLPAPAIGDSQEVYSARAFSKAIHDIQVVDDVNMLVQQINTVSTEINESVLSVTNDAADANNAKLAAEAARDEAVGAISALPDGVVNDSIVSTTDVWSSSKVSGELEQKAESIHAHDMSDISGLEMALEGKQASLVSGETIKKINNLDLLGGGNLTLGAEVGQISYFKEGQQPAGWLKCDGSVYLQSAYPTLYSKLGLLRNSNLSLLLSGQYAVGVLSNGNIAALDTTLTLKVSSNLGITWSNQALPALPSGWSRATDYSAVIKGDYLGIAIRDASSNYKLAVYQFSTNTWKVPTSGTSAYSQFSIIGGDIEITDNGILGIRCYLYDGNSGSQYYQYWFFNSNTTTMHTLDSSSLQRQGSKLLHAGSDRLYYVMVYSNETSADSIYQYTTALYVNVTNPAITAGYSQGAGGGLASTKYWLDGTGLHRVYQNSAGQASQLHYTLRPLTSAGIFGSDATVVAALSSYCTSLNIVRNVVFAQENSMSALRYLYIDFLSNSKQGAISNAIPTAIPMLNSDPLVYDAFGGYIKEVNSAFSLFSTPEIMVSATPSKGIKVSGVLFLIASNSLYSQGVSYNTSTSFSLPKIITLQNNMNAYIYSGVV